MSSKIGAVYDKVVQRFSSKNRPAALTIPVSDGSVLVPVEVISSSKREAKRRDLVDLVESGISLGKSVDEILDIEDRGLIYDVRTGEVFYPGSED